MSDNSFVMRNTKPTEQEVEDAHKRLQAAVPWLFIMVNSGVVTAKPGEEALMAVVMQNQADKSGRVVTTFKADEFLADLDTLFGIHLDE